MNLIASRRQAWKDTLWVIVVAAIARLVVIAWAASRFPPAADGQFYDVVARRISQGLGYTWLWPDGVVTYAAHYPVGYPAILGGLYALFGPSRIIAMVLNGLCGVATTLCVHRLGLRVTSRPWAMAAGLVAALHPTLLMYTPAMMTELVTAALLIGAATVALLGPYQRWSLWVALVGMGLLTGIATLVRPQQILWAPVLGALLFLVRDGEAYKKRASCAAFGALLVSLVAVGCCLPWTARNCERMERCVFVSANGGWNLYIGASPLGHGAWTSIDRIGIPMECRLVFQEAAKDECFGRAGKRIIFARPWAWAKLVPAKLAKTFDDVGAPGYYLNSSNSAAFGDDAKWWLGAFEVIVQRLLAIAAMLTIYRARGERSRTRRVVTGAAILATVLPYYAWLGAVLACAGALLLGRRLRDEPTILLLLAGYGMTALVHATFFGGHRYAMAIVPLVIVAAAQGIGRSLPARFRLGDGSVGSA